MPKMQLKPLNERLNAYQQGKRALKIESRRTVAEALGRGLNGVAFEVLRQRKVFVFWFRALGVLVGILTFCSGSTSTTTDSRSANTLASSCGQRRKARAQCRLGLALWEAS